MKLGDIPHGPLIFLIAMLIACALPLSIDFSIHIYYQIRKVLFKKMTKKEQEEWAEQMHFDLLDKILELKDDPFMSDYKWREWLPVCRYSDTIVRTALPNTRLIFLENLIFRMIDRDEALV